MSGKTYRFTVSPEIDQDIIQFLEPFPISRRGELLRHIVRFYQTQMGKNDNFFLPYEQKEWSQGYGDQFIHATEYKIRMDDEVDKSLINFIEAVPRKRRSDFWRHAIRYYMNQLNEGEYFIMPEHVGTTKPKPKIEIQKPKKDASEPMDSLFDFAL